MKYHHIVHFVCSPAQRLSKHDFTTALSGTRHFYERGENQSNDAVNAQRHALNPVPMFRNGTTKPRIESNPPFVAATPDEYATVAVVLPEPAAVADDSVSRAA